MCSMRGFIFLKDSSDILWKQNNQVGDHSHYVVDNDCNWKCLMQEI